MSKIIISDWKGVNSTKAALQLPKGEVSSIQNLRGRPFKNLSKRKGVEPASVQTGPVNGIFDLELDAITIPFIDVGGTLTFFPTLATVSQPDPSPYPSDDPLDPNGDHLFTLLLMEPAMRAANERSARINLTGTEYPPRMFNSSGFIGGSGEDPARMAGTNFYTGSAVDYSWPANNFYAFDLSNYDAYYGQPFGTRAAQLINTIRSQINDNTLLNNYISNTATLQGAASVTGYTTVTLPVPAAATPTTYRSRLVDLRQAIQKLKYISVPATASFPLLNSKGTYTTGEASVAAAKSCVSANYTLAAYGVRTNFTAGCVSSGTSGGFAYQAGSLIYVEAGVDATLQTTRVVFSVTVSPYPNISSGALYGLFRAATAGSYFAPTAYGSPPVNTYGRLATGYGSSFTLLAADIEADFTSMLAAVTVVGNGAGWSFDTVPGGGSLILQLGFTQAI